MLTTPPDSRRAKRALVRTYDPRSYADPWDVIEDFERVQRAAADNPNKGSAALATSLELPRSRIRPWLEDSQPDCYRALQAALEKSWIIEDWNSDTAQALNRLAAWTLASGSINEQWVPTWVTADDDEAITALKHYARGAGIELTRTRVDADRPVEWRPTQHASILGRVLHTWTGVRGNKDRETTQFPRYPALAPDEIAADFARVYVRCRGVRREDKPGRIVQIQETRNDQYRRDLVSLLERVVSDTDDVRGDSWPILLRESATEELYECPIAAP